jgi:DNA replication protein DnaC
MESPQHPKDNLAEQMKLLALAPDVNELSELKSAPIFTAKVHTRAAAMASQQQRTTSDSARAEVFPQHGLLGGVSSADYSKARRAGDDYDPRIFHNITAPSSIFVCGSQGSGKSHTLSCLLENCLISSPANVLPRPLTGVVFHYDTFVTDGGGEPCEAAYLASHKSVKVRVLCAPTNLRTMKVSLSLSITDASPSKSGLR